MTMIMSISMMNDNVNQGTCFADIKDNDNANDNVNGNCNVNGNENNIDNDNDNQETCFADDNDSNNQGACSADDSDNDKDKFIYLFGEKHLRG